MKLIALDLETNGLIVKGKVPDIICWSWCDNESSGASDDLDKLKILLSDEETLPIWHNANFDVVVLRGNNFPIRKWHDTMIMSYVNNTNNQHNLKSWGKKIGFKKLTPPWKDNEAPTSFTPELAKYAEVDAKVTWKLFHYLAPKLDNDDWSIYHMELYFSLIIQEFESIGLPVCSEETYLFKDELEKQVNDINSKIMELGITKVPTVEKKRYRKEHPELEQYYNDLILHPKDGELFEYLIPTFVDFNPNSNDHKAYALKKLYNWTPTKTTKTGKPKVDAEVMSDLPFDLAKYFTELAKTTKILSSFVKPLLEYQDDKGFVHGSYNQTVTRTGRLSSSKPK